MIPNEEFAPGLRVPKELIVYNAPLPSDRPKVSAVSIGPETLGLSGGVLTSRYWIVNQVLGGNVVIRTTI